MAVIEKWFAQDLQKLVQVRHVDGSLFSHNGNGNRIGVELYNNGEPLSSISGTVSGYVVVSDGSTVPCTGSKSGNKASILIPAAAYVPGNVFVTIFVTDGTTVTTVAALQSTVLRTRTGTQVDPGSVVSDWTDTINAAMQEVEDAAENMGGIIATPYASLTYPVPLGKYTFYDGGLYRCISPISTSEEWTAAHWIAVKLGDDVSELKSTLSNVYKIGIGTNMHNPSTDVIGSIKNDGTIDSTATSYKSSDFIPVEQDTNYAFSGYVNDGRKNTSTRLYVALYNDNKEFVSGSYQNVANTSIITFDSGEASYARICSSTANLLMQTGTTTPDTFVAYKETYYNKLVFEDHSIPLEAVANGYLEYEPTNYYTDNSTDVVGSITSTGNIDSSATSYKTTSPIPIKSGISYTISPRLRMLAFYSDITANSTSFISRDAEEKTEPYTFVSAYDGYMRISYNTSYPLTVVETSYSGTPVKKVEEGVSLSNTQIKQAKGLNTKNILTGKKWVVCGDSFTNSGGTGTTIQSGKYAGKSYTYPWIIGNDDRQDMNIVQFFQGGRTLAFPATPGDFTNSLTNPNADWYYQNIPADADYITIYLGINDDHHRTGGGDGEDPTGYIPLGEITDDTTASYLGAWNVVLTWLITNRPNAHIGIIVTNGIASNDNYRLGQIAIAQKYGIPYIDMNGDSRTPAMLRTSNPNIASAVKTALINKWAVNPGTNEHPNDAAQLFESAFIENFLMSL